MKDRLHILLILLHYHLHQKNIHCSGCFFIFISSITLPSFTFLTTGIQVFAPRMLLAVLKGARCTFVFLLGPVWAPGNTYQRPGQSYCFEAFHLKKGLLSSKGGSARWLMQDGRKTAFWVGIWSLRYSKEHRLPPPPILLMSYPVLSCSWSTSRTSNCTCLKLTP